MKIAEILSKISKSQDLHESCMELLDYYHIQYVKISPACLPIDAFLKPEFINGHQELVNKIKEVAVVGMATEDTFLSRTNSEESYDEMECKLDDGHYRDMAFFSIDASEAMTRTEIALLTRALNRRMLSRPCILFVRNSHWLSMATCEKTQYVRSDMQGEKVGKVTILRNINCDNPHRGHVDILDSLDISHCQSFDDMYVKWLETFSNELLTRKFYQELSDWYAWAVQVVRFPNDLEDDTDDTKYNTESTIRLVTRLIFVWFLKEKHLIPEEFFDVKYIQDNLLIGFNPYDSNDNLFGKSLDSRYYKAILQNLFFAMLNCPIANEGSSDPDARRFSKQNSNDHGNNKLLRYKDFFCDPNLFVELANKRVPFLNGGLFDCLDDKEKHLYYDGFSDNEKVRRSLCVPDYLFFGEEVGKAIDLSEFYGDSNKKKVSARGIIDILKRYNFTIEENTPYEQEVSLDPELLGKVFENLLASYNPETRTTARKSTGSFYTPREIVQYMVDESLVEHLKRTVDPSLESQYRDLVSYTSTEVDLADEKKKDIMRSLYNCKILDPACGSGAFPVGMLQQMVHILSRIDPTNENWKELMIENALSESRDAFETESEEERKQKLDDIDTAFNDGLNYPDYARKLYLIEKCIYGVDIQPIAIQISHLRFFISLIVDQKENTDPMKNFGIRPLPNLEAKFVAANSLIPLDRNDNLFTSHPDVKEIEKQLHVANHKIFSARTPKTKRKWREESARLRKVMADKLVDLGAINDASQLVSWDMFDQNSHASFFDSEWMFGIKDGFDIVIGNPPYVVTPRGAYDKYEWYTDLYKMFFERGIKDCLSKEGVLCYITPKFYLVNKDDKKMREYFLNNINVLFWTLCKPFDAVTENVITMLNLHPINKESIPAYIHNPSQSLFTSLPDVDVKYCLSNALQEIVLGTDETTRELLIRIADNHPMLGDVTISKRGAEVSKDFLRVHSNGKPALLGEDMWRYSINWENTFLPANHKEYNRLLQFFDNEMIYLRRVAKCLAATISIDGTNYAFNKNIYGIVPRNDSKYSLKYLLALLNSTVIDFYYKQRFSTKKEDAFPEIQTYLYERLPIANVNKKQMSEIENIVTKLLENYDANLYKELDKIIYQLYGLDSDDILLIEGATK